MSADTPTAPEGLTHRTHEPSGTRYRVLRVIAPEMPVIIGEVEERLRTAVVLQVGNMLHWVGTEDAGALLRFATPEAPRAPIEWGVVFAANEYIKTGEGRDLLERMVTEWREAARAEEEAAPVAAVDLAWKDDEYDGCSLGDVLGIPDLRKWVEMQYDLRYEDLSEYEPEMGRAEKVERSQIAARAVLRHFLATGEWVHHSDAGRPGRERILSNEILTELARARAKFPGDNVTMLALMEEVGELAKATFEESRDRVRKEAVQVAVMAMRVVLDGDATLDGWRAGRGLDPLIDPPGLGSDASHDG